jgi:hypothetical protein
MDFVRHIYQRIDETAPRKYWLVFDIDQRNPEQVDQLEAGVLKGVKGISSSRRIVINFFQVARNACLVMDAAQIEAANHITPIDYHNPESLVANDMAALYRIWDKSPETRYGPHSMMQNLAQYVLGAAKQLGHTGIAHALEYYGYETWIGNGFQPARHRVNAVDDLVRVFHELALSVEKPGKATLMAEMTPEVVRELLLRALQTIGKTYSDEAEIAVNGDLVVPAGSTLMVAIPKEYFRLWQNRETLKGFDAYNAKYALDKMAFLVPVLERLGKRYRISIIEPKRYEDSRGRFFARQGR